MVFPTPKVIKHSTDNCPQLHTPCLARRRTLRRVFWSLPTTPLTKDCSTPRWGCPPPSSAPSCSPMRQS
eukprot:9493205-Pyramimonas_sp.AAC.1